MMWKPTEEAIFDWQFKVYLYASHIHYHTALADPLRPWVYKAVIKMLDRNRLWLPLWFNQAVPVGQMEAVAHAVELDEDEIKKALEWAQELYDIQK